MRWTLLLLCACTRPAPEPPREEGGWVIGEDRGSIAWVWTVSVEGSPEPIEARCWVAFKPGVGEIGVAEARVIHPEPGRSYRFRAHPAPGVTLLSPAEVDGGCARFEFRGWGRAGLRIWAARRT